MINSARRISEGSLLVTFIKELLIRQHTLELWLAAAFKDSRTGKIISLLRESVIVAFRHSFLGKVTEIKKETNPTFLENSKCIRLFLDTYKDFSERAADYLSASKINGIFAIFKQRFYSFPVKTGSIIIIAILLSNISLSLLLRAHLGLAGLLLRGILLFIAYSGLHSDISLENLSKTSYFIKCLNNSCKIRN